jgi:hypothetical protein
LKRFFLAAFLMLAIGAFAVMPAFASGECSHDMAPHAPTVASLTAHVQHANAMGHIKSSLMPSLLAQLNTAGNESLPVSARVGALQSFIGLVNAQAGKGIDAGCAEHLVMHAEHVIADLNGQM